MKRPSTVLFIIAVALACIATISYVNTSEVFLPETSGSTLLQVVFIITSIGMMALGLICRRAEKAIYRCPGSNIAVKLSFPA